MPTDLQKRSDTIRQLKGKSQMHGAGMLAPEEETGSGKMPGAMPDKGQGPAVVVAIGKKPGSDSADSSPDGGGKDMADQMPPGLTKATEDPNAVPAAPVTLESLSDKVDMLTGLLKTLVDSQAGGGGAPDGGMPDAGAM